MEWFRFYNEALDDPKVQKLSPVLFKHWVNLLCLANLSKPRGQLPNADTIAFRLRLSPEKANAILVELADIGLIDVSEYGDIEPHNWKERQYGKPSNQPERVAERVRKHRNADVTPPKRDVTPRAGDKTDTDTDTDTEQNLPPKSPKGEPKPKTPTTIKTPIPDNFIDQIPVGVIQDMSDEQKMSLTEIGFETGKMVDHFRSKGERRVDWVAAWRNWMRSDFRKPRGSPPTKGRPTQNGRVGYTMDELKRLANGESLEPARDNTTTHDAGFRVVR
jgi:hypothetical protein